MSVADIDRLLAEKSRALARATDRNQFELQLVLQDEIDSLLDRRALVVLLAGGTEDHTENGRQDPTPGDA